MDHERVSMLLQELYAATIDGGATEVRITLLLGDGSRVVFCCNDDWLHRDWVVGPNGEPVAALSGEVSP